MMEFLETLQAIWRDHGTKLLGAGSILLGVLSTLDVGTIALIKDLLGEKLYTILLILGGVMTAWRGYSNTNAQRTGG